MTNYPYLLDSVLTLPTVAGVDEEASAINALQEAVLAIEEELGIKPSTPYGNMRNRLDICESKLNFGVSPSIPNDGYVKSPLYILNEIQEITLSISDGYGVPSENRVNGSLFMRADGYANQDLYIRRDGYWSPIQTTQKLLLVDVTSTPFNVVDGYFVTFMVNTTTAKIINLPANPTIGDPYRVKDATGNAAANNITVQGNGHNIDGSSSHVISTNYSSTLYVFNGTQWSKL
jgi:hypothetical protein